MRRVKRLAVEPFHRRGPLELYRGDLRDVVPALGRFDADDFSPDACRNNALGFSIETFKHKFGDYVQRRWDEHVAGAGAPATGG